MTRARVRWGTLAGNEYELVNFTDDAEWVLRDVSGDVVVFDDGFAPGWFMLAQADPDFVLESVVEVRCDFCGRWSTDATPGPYGDGRWRCWGGTGPCGDASSA